MGVLKGDFAGYPNGRRLEDDIVDIDLRAFAEGYGPILNDALGLPNRSPNNTLGDGVDKGVVRKVAGGVTGAGVWLKVFHDPEVVGPWLEMDAATEQFVGRSETVARANELLRRKYREPFVVPERV